MDLRHLTYFERVARLGVLTRAAADLGLSQPALSRHIARLEHELRTPLFVRSKRGMRLTDAGQHLLGRIEPLLTMAQQIFEETAARSGEAEGEVSLCMPSGMHENVTVPVLLEYQRRFPRVRVRVSDGFDGQLRELLATGAADLGVLLDPNEPVADTDERPMLSDTLVLFGRHPRDAPATVRLAEVAALPLALPPATNPMRRRIEAALRKAGLAPRILEIDSYQLISDLVARGEAYTVGLSVVARPGARFRQITPRVRLSWSLAVRRARRASAIVTALAELIEEQLRQIVHEHSFGKTPGLARLPDRPKVR